jgi:RNA polymerase sigma-70 factor (ECF subfamily)
MPTVASLPPFAVLVDDHGAELLAHARRLAGDDGEDVLHDALLRALRAYPKLRHGEHLRAWLYRITTRCAIDHHDRRKRRAEVLVGEPPDGAAHHDPGDPDEFSTLIAPLPDGARAALTLRYVDDLAYEDIAERLGTSPQAARQRVSTAVRDLRARLS